MAKTDVVSVRPIAGSNGRGFEVENMKEKWTSEIIEIASELPNVELKHLLWFARAFEKQVKTG